MGILGTYSFAVITAHLIMGENPEAWPGDDWRAVGKIYVGAATTWLLWHNSRRSLDRNEQT